jgi:ubiquinone/menaquinone biosynthesis C-methylase UbiE
MPNENIDAAAFNAFEKQGWQQSADPYQQYFGSLTAQAGAALLAAVGPPSGGKTLLDVASGPGYLAQKAAEQGFQNVVGIDFSNVMVALARREAAAAGSRVEFKEEDAEAMAEADACYDAVTMNFGLLHLGQPQKAIAEAYRVLKTSGTFAFTVWAEPQKSIGFAIILAAIEAFADKAIPVPEGPPFFYFSKPSNNIDALKSAGFSEVSVREIDLLWSLDSGEALYDAFLNGTARTGGLLRAQSEETLRAIRGSVMKDAEKYRAGSQIQIPMCAVMTTGRKIA